MTSHRITKSGSIANHYSQIGSVSFRNDTSRQWNFLKYIDVDMYHLGGVFANWNGNPKHATMNQAIHPSRRSAVNLNHSFFMATWVIGDVPAEKMSPPASELNSIQIVTT